MGEEVVFVERDERPGLKIRHGEDVVLVGEVEGVRGVG